jgi:5-carboxymethyl-2-hydroxymuconic-semialdehyde dehydrogenase
VSAIVASGSPAAEAGRRVAEVAGVTVPLDHLIGGRPVASPDTFEVRSPIDGSLLGEVARGGAADIEAAVRAAREAFPAWAALGPEGRGVLLDALAARIRERNDDLAAVETADNGSLLLGNVKRVIARGAHNISFFSDWARTLAHPPIHGDETDDRVAYDPAGVCALIVPWNAPFMLGTWKIGPALAAGNTVVVKPPEWAPLTLRLLADLALDVGIPPGVLNVVQGIGEEAGAALVSHPDVDRISFTGSPDTGRAIAAAAAANLTPCSFELGGKSPFVVFADADLDDVARTICGQFVNAGQVCLAGTRVLVEDDVADDLLERVLATLPSFPLGDPRELSTRVGPLIHPEHHARVSGFVERALAGGARPLVGGRPSDVGPLWFEPTILTDVDRHDEIVRQEVFGPVLTWQTFDAEAEAIDMANDTAYGLAAMVYTSDVDRADRVSARVRAGTVWVNCFFVRNLASPFGGIGESGVGREGGTWSFDFYCDVKNISVRRGSLA